MSFHHAHHVNANGSTFNNICGDQFNVMNNARLFGSESILQKLQPAKMDASDRTGCLHGTREDLLRSITEWATNLSGEQRLFWLHGVAGCGKTTLATTIANVFREQDRLGAFLFFDRDDAERNDPSLVIRTLAYQLGEADLRIGHAISDAIEKNPGIIRSPLRFQFSKLLIQPLSSIEPPLGETTLVIVLDALDECGSPEQREQLLDIFSKESSMLPSSVRIFITSRAEPDITNALGSHTHIISHQLDITSASNHDDIFAFFQHSMTKVRTIRKHLFPEPDWPGNDTIHQLTARASGLIVWASTAVRFINGYDPKRRLDTVLKMDASSAAESALDALYITALNSVGTWDDPQFVEDFQSILGIILVAKNPLSSDTIDKLSRMSGDVPSMHTISLLGSVLTQTPVVRILHPSFADFLLDRTRCGNDARFIDPSPHNLRLGIGCLNFLQSRLQRNIYGLTLTSAPVTERLPDDISYACAFWIDHICASTMNNAMVEEPLERFMFQHFLHWLEAMSLLKRSREAGGLLRQLLGWTRVHIPDRDSLCDLINDGLRFTQIFACSIGRHPLLVYLTALPFTPTDTILYRTFHNIDHFPWIVGEGAAINWGALLMVRELPGTGIIACVTFSPGGEHIVCGTTDGIVYVFETLSGLEALKPLCGHGGPILSITYSSDGSRIASSSMDGTVCIWDSTSATQTVGPLRGHEHEVRSVAFSPDGKRIASGSWDQTIRVWDAISGKEVFPPLRGHRAGIETVLFSLDGTCIISGSHDINIRIWNAQSGVHLSSTFFKHQSDLAEISWLDGRFQFNFHPDAADIKRLWDFTTCTAPSVVSALINSWIRSLVFTSSGLPFCTTLKMGNSANKSFAFCPDGRHIGSASFNNKLCLWDGRLLQPDDAHNRRGVESQYSCRIISLAFSQDGLSIASGTFEGTVCVWAAMSATLVLGPLHGHQAAIVSVSFSPDDTSILTGSKDFTVRVWDAVSGSQRIVIHGHENVITSVVFSPDGTRIASASKDQTIRIWNATSGDEELVMRGHDHSIIAMSFSPSGKQLVTSSFDKLIRIWDTTSGTECFAFGHSDGYHARSVAYTAGGERIVSDHYRVIHEWDASSGELICSRHTDIGVQLDCTGNRWVFDITTYTAPPLVAKILPPFMSPIWVSCRAVSRTSIALLYRGKLCVIHFPTSP